MVCKFRSLWQTLTPAVPDTTHVQVQRMPCASLMAHGWMTGSSGQTGTPASRREGSMAEANLEDRWGFRCVFVTSAFMNEVSCCGCRRLFISKYFNQRPETLPLVTTSPSFEFQVYFDQTRVGDSWRVLFCFLCQEATDSVNNSHMPIYHQLFASCISLVSVTNDKE